MGEEAYNHGWWTTLPSLSRRNLRKNVTPIDLFILCGRHFTLLHDCKRFRIIAQMHRELSFVLK